MLRNVLAGRGDRCGAPANCGDESIVTVIGCFRGPWRGGDMSSAMHGIANGLASAKKPDDHQAWESLSNHASPNHPSLEMH